MSDLLPLIVPWAPYPEGVKPVDINNTIFRPGDTIRNGYVNVYWRPGKRTQKIGIFKQKRSEVEKAAMTAKPSCRIRITLKPAYRQKLREHIANSRKEPQP